MTLLFFLRPKRDYHEPQEVQAIFDRIKKRYEKKLVRPVKAKSDRVIAEEKDSPLDEMGSEKTPAPIAPRYDAELSRTIQLRDKLMALKDILEAERWRERMRRVALREMALRQEIARIKQEEEDETIMLMLWELIN